MAEFSKQWCELNDPEMPWDFDIEEMLNYLEEGTYTSRICEGFGFSAIGKFSDGPKVYIINWTADADEQRGQWIPLEEILKNKY